MSRWVKIVVCAALIWMLPSGCSRDRSVRPEESQGRFIRMTFSAGSSLPATKADNTHSGLSEESQFKQIQVWVFNSDSDALPVAYKELSGDELSRLVDSYGEVTLTFEIDPDNLSSGRQIDIYVAANAGASGVILAPDAHPSNLDTAVLRYFSPSDSVATVPQGGLPISRVVRHIDAGQYLSSAYSTAPPIRIPLVRSVCKISFYFLYPTGLQNASIQQVVLDGGSICNEDYFFPAASDYSDDMPDPTQAHYRVSGGYHSSPMQINISESAISYHPDPASLTRGPDEDIEDYVGRLEAASVKPSAITYLKEAGRTLSGTIYYKMGVSGSKVQQLNFSLDTELFVRNHEWIIYAFFAKDRLYILPEVSPWTDAGLFSFDWSYSLTLSNLNGNAHIMNENAVDYIKCAWGMGTDGLPYSPKLQLSGRSSVPSNASMLLVLDNPDFGFIRDDGGVLSTFTDSINMPLETTDQFVIFYVVPKHAFDLSGPNPSNPVCQLKLLLSSQSLASIRLPFNTIGLPGDTDSILYHYVTPDAF